MSFKELLVEAMNSKKRVVLNGFGSGTTKATIIEMREDYLTLELIDVEVEKNTKKEKVSKEIIFIPIDAVTQFGEGVKVQSNQMSLGGE